MDPYDRLQKIRTVLAAASAAILTALIEPLAGQLGEQISNVGAIPTVQILAALIGWATISVLILPLVESSKYYRRVVLGRKFIEGVWITVATPIELEHKTEQTVEVLEIDWVDTRLCLTGTVYSKEGAKLARFRSRFSKLEWPILNHQVEDVGAGPLASMEGLAEMHFHKRDGVPLRFSGHFDHVGMKNAHSIEGIKITRHRDRKLLDDKAKRREFIALQIDENIP